MFRPTLKIKLSYRILLQVNMASDFVLSYGNIWGIWNAASGWKMGNHRLISQRDADCLNFELLCF